MKKLACLILALTAAAALGGLACTEDPAPFPIDDDDGGKNGGTDGGVDSKPPEDSSFKFEFRPLKSYSGYDGVHTFKAPVAVYDSDADLKVTGDPSAVTIEPVKLKNPVSPDGIEDKGKYFLITVKKPGTHTITATSKGKSVQVELASTQYDSAQWTAGETRYKNQGTNNDPPCTNCHVNGDAIDHSPAALSSVDDEKVGSVITSGISTAGFPILIDNKPGHKWTVTEDERKALVVYLRGLEPRGFLPQ
jgi:hypothetical protein